MLKRSTLINRYAKKPIVFKSLTFSGRSRKSKIVDYNKNYKSKINAFIEISFGERGESLFIPIKYAKRWFGNMKDFNKKYNNFEFTITFNEREKEVKVHICKED